MIRAVGANRANDRASFVREGIDILLVTNRTPHAADVYTDQESEPAAFPEGTPKHTGFLRTLNNDFFEIIPPWLTPQSPAGRQAHVIYVTVPNSLCHFQD
jgi:hypothetical protein